MNTIELFENLLHCENEFEVIKKLKTFNIWYDKKYWKAYGNNENNLSSISNQQANPYPAFVEKIVNSIDAVLLRECKKEGINPESNDAPKTINNAVSKYKDHIKSDDIQIYATGYKDEYPNIIIADKGEGQSPKNFEDTLLSLNKSNKLRIPFVQGKFNMGSTGVLPFCGEHSIQLIVSKKDPTIKVNDENKSAWSFTITRKNSFDESTKNSVIEYLVIEGKTPIINQQYLNILPDKTTAGATYTMPMEWGTYIKMFDYKVPDITIIKGYFSFKISHLLPELPFHIFISDRRDFFQTPSNKLSSFLKGNKERLITNKMIVQRFPIKKYITIDSQEVLVDILLLKDSSSMDLRGYKNSEGITYLLNGQVHGFTHDRIFTRNDINLDYIKKNILVYVDVSNIGKKHREDLFMSNREVLRNSTFKQNLEDLIIVEIKDCEELKIANQKKRNSMLKNKTNNDMHIVNSIQKTLRHNPTLLSLFDIGGQLKDLNILKHSDQKTSIFKGLDEPTYFDITMEHTFINPKEVPKNATFRIKFKTDVKNDFFERELNKGVFKLTNDSEHDFNYSLSLTDGNCSILVSLPKGIKVGNMFTFNCKVIALDNTFDNTFTMKIIGSKTTNSKEKSKRKNKKNNPQFKLPELIEVGKKEWDIYDFDEKSVLKNIGNDLFINMDNAYLLKHIKKEQYKKEQYFEEYKTIFMMYAIGFKHQNTNNENKQYVDITNASRALAPVIFETSNIIDELRK